MDKKYEEYLKQDSQNRTLAFFDKDLMYNLDFNMLNLSNIVDLAKNDRHSDVSLLNNFLIDLSWKSSELEGNSYSLLDSKALIEYGQPSKEASNEDTLMILNHKSAIKYLFNNNNFFSCENWSKNIIEINSLLLKNIYLENRGGILRRHGELEIYHSSYIPSTNKILLDKTLNDVPIIINKMNSIEQLFYLFSRLPYVQFFFDGDKRTSRLLCNKPLLNAGMTPISMIDIDKSEYLKSLLVFYELGDDSAIRQTFLHGYANSILRYSSLSIGQKMDIRSDGRKQQVVQDMIRYFSNKDNSAKPNFFNNPASKKSSAFKI